MRSRPDREPSKQWQIRCPWLLSRDRCCHPMWKRDREKTLGLADANVPEDVAVEARQLMTVAHALPPPAQQAENALRHRPQPDTHLNKIFRSARDRPKGRTP